MKVKLHPEVTVLVTVNVARSQEEALIQAEKGAALTKAAAEKAEVEAAFGVPSETATASEASSNEATETKKPAKKAKAAKTDASDEAPKAKKTKTKKVAEA